MVSIRLLAAVTLAMTVMAYSPRADLDAGHYLKALAEAEAQLKSDPSDALAWAAKSQALASQQ